MKSSTTLVRRLREAWAKSGKSKTAIARECGVHPVSVSRWFAGSVPNVENLSNLSEALGVSPLWLAGGAVPMDGAHPSGEEPAGTMTGRFLPERLRSVASLIGLEGAASSTRRERSEVNLGVIDIILEEVDRRAVKEAVANCVEKLGDLTPDQADALGWFIGRANEKWKGGNA